MIAVTRYRSNHGQLVWMACMNGSSKNRVTSSSLFQQPPCTETNQMKKKQKKKHSGKRENIDGQNKIAKIPEIFTPGTDELCDLYDLFPLQFMT